MICRLYRLPLIRTSFKEILTAENTGLFFLDIDLKSDMNGLTLAQRIRQIQPRCFIVFITSHSEMSFLTFQYKAEALDFIVKDTTEHIKSKIHECLVDVNSKYTSVNNEITRTFTINQNDKRIAIDYNDIIFLRHRVIFTRLFSMLKNVLLNLQDN